MPRHTHHGGVPRPTDHEILKKVRDALEAIEAGRRQIALTKHLVADCEELGLSGEAELWELLPSLFRELIQCDPVQCYVGGRPPIRSFEPGIRDKELWAFAWPSVRLGREVYLKFVMMKNKAGEPWYMHVDVHPDRPEKKGGA